jgi:hypothetical protein
MAIFGFSLFRHNVQFRHWTIIRECRKLTILILGLLKGMSFAFSQSENSGQRLVHRTLDKVYIRQCLKTFHNSAKVLRLSTTYSAKVSYLSKFLEKCFWSNLTQNSGKKMWKCLFFLLYKCHNFCTKKLFILSGRPQLSTIRRKSQDFPLFGECLRHCVN